VKPEDPDSTEREQFAELLKWLDPNSDRAPRRYEEVRKNLMRVFTNRGCTEVEDLADETFTRVAKKMPGLRESYVGEPEKYLYAIARNVAREHIRKRGRVNEFPPEQSSREDLEPFLKCLEECLAKLPRSQANLILLYYEKQRRAKIDLHKKMSSGMGLRQTALRARVHRIRKKLRICILDCLGHAIESNNMLLADI
jgi:RNA polymerase sigma factor (sigma-70 family)